MEKKASIKLTFNERLTILGILPQEGNFTTLKILRDLQEALSFTEEEYKKYEIKNGGEKFVDAKGEEGIVPIGQIRYNPFTTREEVERPIGSKGKKIIADALKELDKNKKLNQNHYSLYEKFIENAQIRNNSK